MNARRAIAATAAVVAVIGLAGCANGSIEDPTPGIRAVTVQTEDGRTVDCVTRASGGIHCDWENAR